MPKKNSDHLLFDLVSLCFIIGSLLLSIHFWSFNESFYRNQHSSIRLYGKSIADHIGISEEDLDELTHFTLVYLNDPDASLDLQMKVHGSMREIFTDDEKLHMVDVQRLNLFANFLMIVTLAVSLAGFFHAAFKKKFSLLFGSYKRILLCTGLVLLVLGSWILIDFDSFWTMFHHVFFPGNDLWLLDLRTDILIMIVPPEFFNHLVVTIVVTYIGILGLSFLCLRAISRKEAS